LQSCKVEITGLKARKTGILLQDFSVSVKYRHSEGGPRKKNSLLERNYIMLFAPKEQGQGLVEYAIILALVAIVVIAVMRLLGPKIGNTFSSISNSLP
jgi:pilus assembly protein Flp/PilA